MVWCRATFITSNNNHYYLCFSLIFACYQRPKMFTFSYLCPLFLILLVRFSFPSTSITHTWFWTYLLSSQSVTLLHVSHLHYFCNTNVSQHVPTLPHRLRTRGTALFYVFPPVFVSILIITLPTSR